MKYMLSFDMTITNVELIWKFITGIYIFLKDGIKISDPVNHRKQNYEVIRGPKYKTFEALSTIW